MTRDESRDIARSFIAKVNEALSETGVEFYDGGPEYPAIIKVGGYEHEVVCDGQWTMHCDIPIRAVEPPKHIPTKKELKRLNRC